jgi:hypothetical protein
MKKIVPSEYHEQVAFVEWLELMGYTFTAIPNSTWTSSWGVKMKNKKSGVRPGLPDILIAIPNKCIIFVEMKRIKGGVLSEFQKQWITTLNTIPNVECFVCKGCEEAIKKIKEVTGKT